MWESGDTFPGDKWRGRHKAMRRYRDLIRGDFRRAFDVARELEAWADTDYGLKAGVAERAKEVAAELRIVINLPRVIERKFANMLTRGARLVASREADQQQLDEIIERSRFKTAVHAGAFRLGTYGNAIFSVRRSDDLVYIDSRDPWTWYPETDPADATHVLRHVFAWIYSGRDRAYLLQEIHEAGLIRRVANGYNDGKVLSAVSWDEALGVEPGTYREEEPTDIAVPLVSYWRNITDDDTVLGDSDLLGNESIFNEVASRITRIADILDKHSAPKMQGPASAMRADPISGRPTFDMDGDRYYPREDGDDPEFAYLTWESQLAHAFDAFDRTVRLACTCMEMAPALIGLAEGAGAEATETLRIRATNTLDAVEAKRLFAAEGMQQMADIALQLAGVRSPESVDVQWGDPLPPTRKEMVETVGMELGRGLTSLERAIKRLNPSMSEEDVAAEIERIRGDELRAFNPGQA